MSARLTQAELAERAGVSERAISDIERGLRTRVYPVTARALADALGLVEAVRRTFELAAQAGRRSRQRVAGTGATVAAGPAIAASGDDWPAIRRTPMVGRADELAALLGALRDDGPRLHTVTGTGGIGKSRLAAEVCASYDDASASVTWVSLAALRQPELVLAAVASAVGLPDDGDGLLGALARALDQRVLLVLDTFEPVLAAARDVAALVDRTSGLRVLVTSRAPLRVRGERELPLRPLSEPAGAELFRQRAKAARPGLVLDDGDARRHPSTTSSAGFPACHSPSSSPLRGCGTCHCRRCALSLEIERPLQRPSDGERDLPERQQTMRATIEVGYDLLAVSERQVFRRLAAFVDAWTLDVAEQVLVRRPVSLPCDDCPRWVGCANTGWCRRTKPPPSPAGGCSTRSATTQQSSWTPRARAPMSRGGTPARSRSWSSGWPLVCWAPIRRWRGRNCAPLPAKCGRHLPGRSRSATPTSRCA